MTTCAACGHPDDDHAHPPGPEILIRRCRRPGCGCRAMCRDAPPPREARAILLVADSGEVWRGIVDDVRDIQTDAAGGRTLAIRDVRRLA